MNVLELSMPRAIVCIYTVCVLYFVQSGTVSMIVKLTRTLRSRYDSDLVWVGQTRALRWLVIGRVMSLC